MKTYFKQLFDYDHYANQQILKAIIENSSPEKATGLLAHLLRAQQVWLPRCLGQPSHVGTLWPNWTADDLGIMIENNYTQWLTYLDTLTEVDFENIIAYKTTSGVAYENALQHVLAHVINHGTHHRAQIGQQLLLVGATQLPATDFIFYLRDNK